MREKLTNEEFHDILSTRWTFSDVTSLLDKGSYDDLVELPELQRGRTHDVKPARAMRSSSRGRSGQQKRASSAARPKSSPPANKPKIEEKSEAEPPMVERAPSSGYTPSYVEDTGIPPAAPSDAELPPVHSSTI